MVCENCNTINDSNTEKCAKCGADLSNQAERDIQSSGVDVEQNIDNGQIYKSEDSAICKHCGALISKNDKLCPHCNGYVGKEDPDFPKSKRNLGIIFSGLVPVLGLIALLIFGYGLGFVWFVIAKPGLFVLFFGLAGALISYIALTVILLKYPKNSYERKSFLSAFMMTALFGYHYFLLMVTCGPDWIAKGITRSELWSILLLLRAI